MFAIFLKCFSFFKYENFDDRWVHKENKFLFSKSVGCLVVKICPPFCFICITFQNECWQKTNELSEILNSSCLKNDLQTAFLHVTIQLGQLSMCNVHTYRAFILESSLSYNIYVCDLKLQNCIS